MQKQTNINPLRERQLQQANSHVTELLAAASAGESVVVQRLFENGTDVNSQDQFGNTALIYAAAGGHRDLVQWLIAQGAQVNTRNQIGMTALRRAQLRGHAEITALLKKFGAEEASPSTVQEAHRASGPTSLLHAAREGNLAEVRACLAIGADVNAQNGEGWTALMMATLKGHEEIVETLLKHEGARVNARSHHGWTALRFAVSMGDGAMIKMLLAAGAEVNAQDHDGWTALMQAAGEGNAECLQILLAGGADVRVRNKIGETAHALAAHKGFAELVEILEKAEQNSQSPATVPDGTGAPPPSVR